MKILLENWKRFLNEGKKVKIFRAQPAFTKVIRKNDYVTLSRKFAGDHAVTSAIYNDEPFFVVYAFVDEDKIKEADNPGEYRYIGDDFEAKPSQIADTEGNLRFARNLREATIVRGVDLEKILPQEVLDGEEDFDEEEGEEGVLVKNIPMKALSMLDQQGKNIMGDIDRGELSMTEGLPVLFYHTEKKQLIVDDGNHRIFQRWLAGQDTFDAYVYSGSYSSYLRHVHDGEEEFDWSERHREE